MTIQELITILTYADVNPFQKVIVKVNHSGAFTEFRDILSYSTHPDGIELNIVVTNLADDDYDDDDDPPENK